MMVGWTSPVSDNVRAMLSPEAAKLPQVSRLTGRVDVTEKIVALKPDLILDYGTVAPRYIDLAKATQQRTGIPTVLLSGSLADVPRVFRLSRGIVQRGSLWPCANHGGTSVAGCRDAESCAVTPPVLRGALSPPNISHFFVE
jgi:hypothetical protein